MASNLFFRPKSGGVNITNLKYALQEEYLNGSSSVIILKNIDILFIRGIKAGNINETIGQCCDLLIEAIEKYGEVEIYCN